MKRAKSPKGAKPLASPKSAQRKIPVAKELPLAYTLTEEPTGEALLTIRGDAVILLEVRIANSTSLGFLGRFPNLKWLDLSSCRLSDEQLQLLPQIPNLQVILLDNNQLASTKPLRDFPLLMPKLSIITVVGNPLASSLEELQKLFAGCLVIGQRTPESDVVLELKKECIQLQHSAQQNQLTVSRLRQELFELDHRRSIDLSKYLQNLKQYLPQSCEVVHSFFASAKRFAEQDPSVRANHPRVPWVLLQQWPQRNFFKDYPALQAGELVSLFEQKEPHHLVESRQLDGLLQQLLDDYYKLEIQELLKKAVGQPNWENIRKLVEFAMVTAVPFLRRYQLHYDLFADLTYGDNIQTEMALLLLLERQQLRRLADLLSDPSSEQTRSSPQIRDFLRAVKMLRVRKMVDCTRNYSVREMPFCELNLAFFNSMYRAIDDDHLDVFDLTLADRVQFFSNLLLNAFNCRDYMDFAGFIRSGQSISEEFFQKNMKLFKEIVGVYEWVKELEELNRRIPAVQPEQRYQTARSFLKKLIGRPSLSVALLKKYFPNFNFELGQSLIDSPVRHNSVNHLLSMFPDGFGFVISALLDNQRCLKMEELESACLKLKALDAEQSSFMRTALGVVTRENMFIHANPALSALVETPDKYPLVQDLLHNSPTEALLNDLLAAQQQSDIEKIQKQQLLLSLRRLIFVDGSTLQLTNRNQSTFLSTIFKLQDKQMLSSSQRILALLEFSHELNRIHLRDSAAPVPHMGQLDSKALESQCLSQYLKTLGGSVLVKEYLCKVLREQLYGVIFENEQSFLTFNIQKYKSLRKLPLTEEFLPAETREILDMISDNSIKEFIQVKVRAATAQQKEGDPPVRPEELPLSAQFYTQHLREGYYASIIKDCLKKGLSNLAEYSERLNRVEETFMKKTLTRSRIPLTEICAIVKTSQFRKSELRNQLVRFFKSAVRTQQMSQRISEEYMKVAAQITAAKRRDEQILLLTAEIVEKQPLKIYWAFLSCLELFVGVHDRSRIYPHLDWEFFDSYYQHNHFCGWKHHFPEMEVQLEKHSRLFGKYLQRPTECHNEHENIKRGCQKLKQLVYNFELDSILNLIGDELKLDSKALRKFDYNMTANKINVFFDLLRKAMPERVEWLTDCEYDFTCAVRDKLGHRGFVHLKEHFLSAFTAKPKIEPLLKIIAYKVQYYLSQEKLSLIHKQRVFNPALYFGKLVGALGTLSSCNILNTEIEEKIVGGWPLLPWSFFDLSQELCSRTCWRELLEEFNAKHGIYLQLVGYLQNQDNHKSRGLQLLWKLFELLHSELAANDLIRRIGGLLSEVSPNAQKALEPLVESLTSIDKFRSSDVQEKHIAEACSRIAVEAPMNSRLLLSSLRIVSLRGEYLNRIEKINNKLRNVLSDFDEVCVDFASFQKDFLQPTRSTKLLNSLAQVLLISLKFKLTLFQAVSTRSASGLLAASLRNSFAQYKEMDFKLELVETVNFDSVMSYEADLLRDYVRDIPKDTYAIHSPAYQASELYHIAFCTSIRDDEKYQFVCSRSLQLRSYLDEHREYIRSYRNYLAHYNWVGGAHVELDSQVVSDDKRVAEVERFDQLLREVALRWNLK